MIWECTIPDYDLVSPNRLMRMHFAQRNKEHALVVDLLSVYSSGPMVEFAGEVDISITRQYGYRKRAMDEDNLYGACKILLDALRRPSPRSRKISLGLIKDDSPNIIKSLAVTQEKSKDKTTRIVVRIATC